MPARLTSGPAAPRAEFEAALQRHKRFSFSVLVHSDPASALIDFLPCSTVLQVRSKTLEPNPTCRSFLP